MDFAMGLVVSVFSFLWAAVQAVVKLIFALLDYFFGDAPTRRPTDPAAPEARQHSGPSTPWWRSVIIVLAVAGVVALTFTIAMAVAPREPAQPAKSAASDATKKKAPAPEVRRTAPESKRNGERR